MQTRVFGSTGVKVPVIGQGTWQLRRPDEAEKALRLGLDLGLTHIDTAELYRGSEEVVGRAIKGRRDEVFLVSKVLPRNASYKGTLGACDASLRKLQTDQLDVYLLHWWDDGVRLEEWARAAGELVDQGKTRFVGVSNFDVEQLEAAQKALGRHRIVCDQVYYDMEHRQIENALLPYCIENKIAIVDYSPFGSGRFPSSGRGSKVLREVAERHGASVYQVVLNFLTRDANVFGIPKAEKEDHVRDNAGSLDFELSAEDREALEKAFPRSDGVEVPSL
jgi:diketogulonate reductase-like aldo/keto reductase